METKVVSNQNPKSQKIFSSNHFLDQLEELPNIKFTTKMLRGSMCLEQTKRNKMRRELMRGLGKFFEETFEGSRINTYEVEEGIAIEVEHPDALKCGVGEGFITFILSLSVQSLEYKAFDNAELYREEHPELFENENE